MTVLRRLATVLIFLCLFILIQPILLVLSEAREDQQIILAFTSFGLETTSHADFIKKLTEGTGLYQKANVKIFLGPYIAVAGSMGEGFLILTPPDYYIFIDAYFYLSLNQDEKEALIAHELGHAVYKTSFVDKTAFRTLRQLNIFNEWRMKIGTKYQVMADGFSARKTSHEAMISLLNKLYFTDRDNSDYKTRMESLNKLKQGNAR